MNNNNNIKNTSYEVPLKEIIAPNLSDVNYASSLNEVFNNINSNFGTLANHDFIKGDSGKSVEIKEVEFFKNGNITEYGNKLKECIQNLSDDSDEYLPIIINGEEFTIWSNFEKNPGKLWMIYSTDSDINATPKAISSLYYVFLDGRYANNKIGLANQQDYINLKDFSCILVYNIDENGNGNFTALSNAFPTIYYEAGVGLSWKINGNGTGIPVQGVPGKNGSNATLFIVKGESILESTKIGENTKIEVLGVYEDYEGFREISSYDAEEIHNFNDQSALILSSDGNKNNFYFCKLHVENEIVDESEIIKLYAYCTPSTSINSAINTEEIINSMKTINILGNNSNASSGLRGLFIPLESEKTDGRQKVHLLSATSITNNSATNDLKTDVLFTPIKDINSLNIDNSLEDKRLNVEKYLYLKINKEHEIFKANNIIGGDYLKYRLDRVVLNKDSDYLDVINGINSGSRTYGYVRFKQDDRYENVAVNDKNTCVINRDGNPEIFDSNKYTDIDEYNKYSHLASMPNEFFESLADTSNDINENTRGIYRWVLDENYSKFDPDELKNENIDSYDFDDSFKVIYTTTITPSTATKFLWFNGMSVIENYEDKLQDIAVNGNDKRYVINGWTTSDDNPIFSFLKFIPIYTNKSFSVDTDTALNLNYNVNITGDVNNPNKSITVHGDVNCDNLSVYKLTATGEIKNIYTKDNIIAEKGISIGKNIEGFNTTIDVSGNISGKYLNITNNIESPNASIDNIDNKNINTNEFNVNIYKDNESVANASIGVSDVCDKAIGINISNVHEIDITACNHAKLDEIANVPIITTDVPSHINNNGNIVISNQANDSKNIYFKNTLVKYEKDNKQYDPGLGVSDYVGAYGNTNINKTSFDSAKNFNIHRLSLEATGGNTTNINKSITCSSLSTNSASSSSWSISPTDGSFEGWRNDFSIPTTTIGQIYNVDDNYIKTNYLQNVTISRDSNNNVLSTKNSIYINFNNSYWLLLGIWTGNSSGNWGLLHSDSYMRLRVYYSINNENYVATNIYKDYKFDHSTASNSDDGDYEWGGCDINGNAITNYDKQWRYRSYLLKPSQMIISPSNKDFENIKKAFNDGKTITFKIVPSFEIRAHAENSKKLIGGICVTCPRPIDINVAGISSTKLISGDKNGAGLYKFKINNPTTACKGTIAYTIVETSAGSSDVKATTICNDGIVIRSGEYVFGLGYTKDVVNYADNHYKTVNSTIDPHWKLESKDSSKAYNNNLPVLFYHRYMQNYYDTSTNEPKNKLTTNQGYAQRLNAIPLKDIFAVIQASRESKYMTYGV